MIIGNLHRLERNKRRSSCMRHKERFIRTIQRTNIYEAHRESTGEISKNSFSSISFSHFFFSVSWKPLTVSVGLCIALVRIFRVHCVSNIFLTHFILWVATRFNVSTEVKDLWNNWFLLEIKRIWEKIVREFKKKGKGWSKRLRKVFKIIKKILWRSKQWAAIQLLVNH